jgi:type II restriction enzyme
MHYINKIDASNYSSRSQQIRVFSESWVRETIFCPSCKSHLRQSRNNSKSCDFICEKCCEEFELKSKGGNIGNKIVNGAYGALINRVRSANNPNLCLLQYDKKDYGVENFLIIPRQLFTRSIIEERKPLSDNARRAGWVGCNIIVGKLPNVGKIFYIKNGIEMKKGDIINQWQSTQLLIENLSEERRSWLLDTIACIDKIGTKEFSLQQVYAFEGDLKSLHPSNNHIKAKLRQQLQFLRDKGYLEFLEKGKYRLV